MYMTGNCLVSPLALSADKAWNLEDGFIRENNSIQGAFVLDKECAEGSQRIPGVVVN